MPRERHPDGAEAQGKHHQRTKDEEHETVWQQPGPREIVERAVEHGMADYLTLDLRDQDEEGDEDTRPGQQRQPAGTDR